MGGISSAHLVTQAPHWMNALTLSHTLSRTLSNSNLARDKDRIASVQMAGKCKLGCREINALPGTDFAKITQL
jgi:hypothetical protein